MAGIRGRVFGALNSEGAIGKIVGMVLLVCIGASVTSVVLESVASIRAQYGAMFDAINAVVVAVFLADGLGWYRARRRLFTIERDWDNC